MLLNHVSFRIALALGAGGLAFVLGQLASPHLIQRQTHTFECGQRESISQPARGSGYWLAGDAICVAADTPQTNPAACYSTP